MRILFICIFFSSLFTFPSSENQKTISQTFSIHHLTTSLTIQLDGNVDVILWEKEKISIETTIQDITPATSEYNLDYIIRKGNFGLDCSLVGDARTLLLKAKKNNNTIYQQGHQQKTEQTFKIFIPKRLQYSIQ